MKKVIEFLEKIEPSKKESPFLHTLFDGFHTFLFAPKTVTTSGVHVRDGMDLKRTMVHVVLALQLCYVFGTLNIGHQHYKALGMYPGFLDGAHLKLLLGLTYLIPLFVVAHVVGLGIEFFYAAKKGHPIEEGFLVSGALIPLILPPDCPLWMVGLATAFAVIIGKEAFGGTGMNIFNIALLCRMFLFVSYPKEMVGDTIWLGGIEKGLVNDAGLAYTGASYNWLADIFNWGLTKVGSVGFEATSLMPVMDGVTGATPLGLSMEGGWQNVLSQYSVSQMFLGAIPGSIGESSKVLIILGAIFLCVTKIASWRIMASMILGAAIMAMLLNAGGVTDVPWWGQFAMGSFFFAMAFMATDPVTAASTNKGKYIYGFFIGLVGMLIRGRAYPEAWMLAILFMNVFASLIDHYVIQGNINKRLARVAGN